MRSNVELLCESAVALDSEEFLGWKYVWKGWLRRKGGTPILQTDSADRSMGNEVAESAVDRGKNRDLERITAPQTRHLSLQRWRTLSALLVRMLAQTLPVMEIRDALVANGIIGMPATQSESQSSEQGATVTRDLSSASSTPSTLPASSTSATKTVSSASVAAYSSPSNVTSAVPASAVSAVTSSRSSDMSLALHFPVASLPATPLPVVMAVSTAPNPLAQSATFPAPRVSANAMSELRLDGNGFRYASTLVSDALVERVIQLLQAHPSPENVKDRADEVSLYEMWWGYWQIFGEQLYALVDVGLVDFVTFVHRLAHAASGVRDNAIVWLLAQCLPIDVVKSSYREDILAPDTPLLTRTLRFVNEQQMTVDILSLLHELRNSALSCFAMRLPLLSLCDTRRWVSPTVAEHFVVRPYERYRPRWLDSASLQLPTQLPDLRTLPTSEVHRVCVWSAVSTIPISEYFERLLEHDQEVYSAWLKSDSGNHPNREPPCQQPIATIHLAILSIRCKLRIIDKIENKLFDSAAFTEPLAPSILETYARLLHTSPGTNSVFRYQNNLRKSGPPLRLHTLLELLDYRLYRFFLVHSPAERLFLDLYQTAMTTRHYQLFWALQRFLLKASFNFSKVITLTKFTEQIDFGEVLNRNLPFAIARTLVIRGTKDYSKLAATHTLLQRLWTLTGHTPSVSTLQFFPPSLLTFYRHKLSAVKRISVDVVLVEVQRVSSFTTVEQLRDYYSHEEAQLLLLCVVWHQICGALMNGTYPHSMPPLYHSLPLLYYFITPQRLTRSVYLLVQHVLEYTVTSRSDFNSVTSAPSFPFAVAQSALSEMLWGERALFDFTTLLCALADQLVTDAASNERTTHTVALLRYLLLQDPHWTTRLNDFFALNLNSDPWKEDDWTKLIRNQVKYPPKWVLGCAPSTTPATPSTSASNVSAVTLFPSVHGHVCTAVLPALDYLFCKFIEAELIAVFYEFIEAIRPLYAYHSTPLTFVHDTLFYYFESPAFRKDPTMKLALLRLLLIPKVSFSPFLLESINDINFVYSDHYFNELLRTLYDVETNAEPSVWAATEELRGPKAISHQYTCTVIELLSVMSPSMQWIFSPIQFMQWPKQLGQLFARLPRMFQEQLHTQLVSLFTSLNPYPVFWTWAEFTASSLCVPYSVVTTSTNRHIGPSHEERLILLMHAYFANAPSDRVAEYAQLLRRFRGLPLSSSPSSSTSTLTPATPSTPIRSMFHLFLVYRFIAPFMYRLRNGEQLPLAEVLLELVDALHDSDTFIEEVFGVGPFAERHQSLLETIVSFLYRCKKVFALRPQVIEALRAAISTLNIELRRRFSDF
jgi:hypothetical protein